jgi:hypothetical protein
MGIAQTAFSSTVAEEAEGAECPSAASVADRSGGGFAGELKTIFTAETQRRREKAAWVLRRLLSRVRSLRRQRALSVRARRASRIDPAVALRAN